MIAIGAGNVIEVPVTAVVVDQPVVQAPTESLITTPCDNGVCPYVQVQVPNTEVVIVDDELEATSANADGRRSLRKVVVAPAKVAGVAVRAVARPVRVVKPLRRVGRLFCRGRRCR